MGSLWAGRIAFALLVCGSLWVRAEGPTPNPTDILTDEAKPASDDSEGGRIQTIVHNPPGDAPILGPRYAPVTIEFFGNLSDYTQTYRASERLRELAERHPLRLRVVYRLVKRARGENAEAALEAFSQGQFHAFLKEFYGRHRKTPPKRELASIAETAGVDFREIERAWQDNRHADAVTSNHWRQRRFGVTRTPGILVNGKTFNQLPRDLEGFEAIYDDAYVEAQLLIAEGVPLSGIYRRFLRDRAASAEVPRLDIEQVDGPRLGAKFEAQDNGFEIAGEIDYDGPYSEGPRDAPAQVVAYCAIGTRNCNAVARELTNLRAAFGDELRVVFKPVETGLEDEQAESARELHIAADCAGAQGLFWPFLGRVQVRSKLPRTNRLEQIIEATATRAGLNLERFAECRSEGGGALARAALSAEAAAVGVARVPSLVVGGRLYVGSLSFASLSALVEVELAPGMLERWLDD